MSNFAPFGKHVHEQFAQMSAATEIFRVDIDADWLWQMYLNAFPAGTNPIYIKRTEHDCSCCRSFVKNLGNVATINNGTVRSVWDNADSLPYPYNVVAKAMADAVRQKPILQVFRTKFPRYGAEHTLQLIDGKTKRWNHFHGDVKGVAYARDPATEIGAAAAAIHVFRRGLTEIPATAVAEVISLIEAKGLYRGDEHLPALRAFQKLQTAFHASKTPDLFIWENYRKPGAYIRNTVIGSLLVDLADGVEFERAVRSFEAKVAPANYKRPTAIVTPRMIEDALKTIQQEGYESAVKRRHAQLSDISVNNVLFADRNARSKMKDAGSLRSVLMEDAITTAPKFDSATKIELSDFLENKLPDASAISILFEHEHIPRLVSLTAPYEPAAKPMFKWPNNFAWSYKDNTADSDIKQKVKAAGGNVEAALRISLAWYNTDDLDLHINSPKDTIDFGKRRGRCGGTLDVDMNIHGESTTPVENVCWLKTYPDGEYTVRVNNYRRRNNANSGYTIEIECNGVTHTLSNAKSPTNGYTDVVANITVRGGQITELRPTLGMQTSRKDTVEWGLKTQTLVPVSSIMYSPNHWDSHAIGNRHVFFMLQDCHNPDPVRGFYNEFLSSELDKHRKVFELLGEKMKAEPSPDQLSGIGFSSTQRAKLNVLITTNKGQSRPYTVNF